MAETFPMKGGDGDYSYAKNSQFQKLASASVKEMIEEAVMKNLDPEIAAKNTVAITDLGCSVGPNTFFTVETLIEAIERKFSPNSKTLEFHVFFSDHSANDFNKLLTSLPPSRRYHAAAAPGSFHGRLFPRNSIAVAHCAHSLHWLSQPPHHLSNEGRIHYRGAPERVRRAYADQFAADLGVFVAARAEEIVSGGILFIIIPATRDGLIAHQSLLLFDCMGESLMDLVKEGVVEESAVDEFNLPIYMPAVGEVKEGIERDGRFSVERMEVTNPYAGMEEQPDVRKVVMHLRAAFEGIFTARFGAAVVDKMFAGVLGKAEEMARCLEGASRDTTQLVLVLKRI